MYFPDQLTMVEQAKNEAIFGKFFRKIKILILTKVMYFIFICLKWIFRKFEHYLFRKIWLAHGHVKSLAAGDTKWWEKFLSDEKKTQILYVQYLCPLSRRLLN